MSNDRGLVIDRYTVSVIPSVTLLNRELHSLKDQNVLAMGADSFQNLDPLPAVATELELVTEHFWQGRRFLNQNFTLDRLLQEKRQAGIVHLATHAKFKAGTPEQSFIQLWDRPIKLNEMTSISWAKPPLYLLVLSACETAIDSTDAELGFTGLAAATGVHSVMGSLWEVSDIGTLALMSEFYIQLQQAPTRAEALRRAQVALRNGTVRVENGTLITSKSRIALPYLAESAETISFQHPFYWSAFTLVGNPW
jgi:CHAT domain-containing protein